MIGLNDTIFALGWTLLHMAWITLLVAIVIQILRSLVINPKIRYRMGVAGMMMLPVIAVIIFSQLISSVISTPEAYEMASSTGFFIATAIAEESAFNLIDWLNTHMDWLILFWFAGMMSFIMRLAFGFSALSRLR